MDLGLTLNRIFLAASEPVIVQIVCVRFFCIELISLKNLSPSTCEETKF
jgi:hypothetical protein